TRASRSQPVRGAAERAPRRGDALGERGIDRRRGKRGMSEPNEIVGRAAKGPASLVGDKYQLVERLGSGGMGTVWRATHKTLGHDVAVKFLEGASDSPEARARFDREARIAARLGDASLHIARVIDHGVLDNTPYLVMEMLQGETLAARLKREKRLPLQFA